MRRQVDDGGGVGIQPLSSTDSCVSISGTIMTLSGGDLMVGLSAHPSLVQANV